MQHDFPLILFEMIELTDALSNVLSPTPIAKTGRPWKGRQKKDA
jgi:hypothetical protein